MAKRKNRDLLRKKPKIEPYDLVLIVCEGEKTEPFYFQDMIEFEGLSSVNIEIISGKGSDPVSVVKTAKSKIKQQEKHLPFNRVYCIIDRDSHANFEQAQNMAIDNDKIQLIISYPSFEFWYLCHFIYSRSPITRTGNKSAGDNCISLLNAHWQNKFKAPYSKEIKNLYSELYEKLEIAIANSEKALREAQKDSEPNPSTQVHELVEYLRRIKKEIQS
ncbi:RloB family protein [Ursidibacter sp. B-7004-1]